MPIGDGYHVAELDEFSWADSHPGQDRHLSEIFCLTFVKDVGIDEVLRLMGGFADTTAVRAAAADDALGHCSEGTPELAMAARLGSWTVVLEPCGFWGSSLTPILSRGTEAVSLLRHDYASPHLDYAVDGELVTGLDPTFPDVRYGTEPARLDPLLREAGFDLAESENGQDRAFSLSLRAIRLITGVSPTYEQLTGPLTSAHFDPWFSAAPKHLPRGVDGPVEALAETKRLTELLGLTSTPGLPEALAAVESGQRVDVTPDSDLGQHVRAWLIECDQGRSTSSSWLTRSEEARRQRATDLRKLAQALGYCLQNPR
ncbi:hypothetical protein SAMN02982929_00592 [Saccharopolyspora kobensis]|uniref:Uncharacterized protein n=1 Tax=Saccharopolyspora kobensis TaxID=146035 RepID=A0A1H5UQI5_9PSEU|nr:DUF6461 domain-containing protein [Saccharopolyspora kobensis]SEF76711.1 hypothetical protein SAMN02982929_00592 [Saccharopolyspora kobensis]SFC71342.1 hypothetical protein SAMN05216506_1011478 [Saccharopolyspora kobensis]